MKTLLALSILIIELCLTNTDAFAVANSSALSITQEQSIQTQKSDTSKRQLITVLAGPYKPRSISFINNTGKNFIYDDAALSTLMIEGTLGFKLLKWKNNSVAVSEGLSYSSMSTKVPAQYSKSSPDLLNSSVSMHFYGFDTRITQNWESFSDTLAAVTPLIELGYIFTFYDQSHPSSELAEHGSVGNVVAGTGFHFQLNGPTAFQIENSLLNTQTPVYFTVKLNHIFSNSNGIDPSTTTALAGLSLGF